MIKRLLALDLETCCRRMLVGVVDWDTFPVNIKISLSAYDSTSCTSSSWDLPKFIPKCDTRGKDELTDSRRILKTARINIRMNISLLCYSIFLHFLHIKQHFWSINLYDFVPPTLFLENHSCSQDFFQSFPPLFIHSLCHVPLPSDCRINMMMVFFLVLTTHRNMIYPNQGVCRWQLMLPTHLPLNKCMKHCSGGWGGGWRWFCLQ